MANPRVSEIAKKLGIESKKAVEILNDELKEFVKSPSSTIMPPTVRKLQAYVSDHPELVKAAGGADEGSAPAAKPAAKPGDPPAPKSRGDSHIPFRPSTILLIFWNKAR